MKSNSFFLLFFLCLLLCGCLRSKPYQRPDMNLPICMVSQHEEMGPRHGARWWLCLEHPELTALIEEALACNSDALQAAMRVAEAQAYVGMAQADRLPSLGVEATAKRAKSSKDVAQPGMPLRGNQFSLSGILNFEIDLWNRLAHASQSMRSQLAAEEKTKQAILLTISCDVAFAYFNLRALDEKISLTRQMIEKSQISSQQRSRQRQAQILSPISYAQAEAQRHALEATLPLLEQQRQQQQHALILLLGRSPRCLCEDKMQPKEQSPLFLPPLPRELPSKLLQHRHDVAAAEMQLQAAHADVQVARAAYFPQLSLSALLGYSSLHLDRLFRSENKKDSLSGTCNIPLYNFGKNKLQMQLARLKQQQAELSYRKTVRQAFQEALDALSSYRCQQESLHEQQKVIQQRYSAIRCLHRLQQQQQVAPLAVLEEEGALLQAEMQESSCRYDLLKAFISVCKALGGELS